MAISTPKLGIIGAVLIISTLIAYILLLSSVIPQYSVFEFYNETNPESLKERKIQLVGDVISIGSDEFNIGDWETNGTLNISIIHKNIARPSGFELGKRVMIEGILKFDGSVLFLEADLISTKCPSKYENA